MSHRAEQDVLEALQRCGVGDEPMAVSLRVLGDVSGWSHGHVAAAVNVLLARGVLEQVQPGSGPYPAIYRLPGRGEGT